MKKNSGYEIELLLVEIFEDLGYVVNRDFYFSNDKNRTVFDMMLEKGDEKFIVEIKLGQVGVQRFRNMLLYANPYQDYVENGYKMILICDKDKIEKKLIKNLESIHIIVWDIDVIKKVQKKLYSLPKNKE